MAKGKKREEDSKAWTGGRSMLGRVPPEERGEKNEAVTGAKRARKKPKKPICPTWEEKERYILGLLSPDIVLSLTGLWQIAKGEKKSPFRGGSESTLRRAVKALAKQGKVNLPRTPKGAIIVELPSVTAANEGSDKDATTGVVPARNHDSYNDQVAGMTSAGADDSVLDEMVSDAVEGEASKPQERQKTEYEIEVEFGSLGLAVACARVELRAREDVLALLKTVWENRHLIKTTKPLPEPSSPEKPAKLEK